MKQDQSSSNQARISVLAVRKLAEEMLQAGAELPTSDIPKATAISAVEYFFVKGLRTFDAIEQLLLTGFMADAEKLLRSLWEYMISASWMAIKPSERGLMLVHESSMLDRTKLAKNAIETGMIEFSRVSPDDSTKAEGTYKKIIDEADKIRATRKTEKRKASTWSGFSVEDMVEDLKASRQYPIYRLFSANVHPSGMDLDKYFTFQEDGGVIVGERPVTEENIASVRITASTCLIKLMDIKNEIEVGGFDDRIKEVVDTISCERLRPKSEETS